MTVKILGLCSSPIKKGNTETLLDIVLESARETGGVETELVTMADWKNFKGGCIHCNFCAYKQTEGNFCAIKDDMTPMYPKLLETDGLILASPVYISKPSWLMTAFIDRLRAIAHGKRYTNTLVHKVGAAAAVLWHRNSGAETTLLSMVQSMMHLGMLPVTVALYGTYGVTGVSSDYGTGAFDPNDKLGVLKDEFGLRTARALGKNVAQVCKMVKLGKEALKSQQP